MLHMCSKQYHLIFMYILVPTALYPFIKNECQLKFNTPAEEDTKLEIR